MEEKIKFSKLVSSELFYKELEALIEQHSMTYIEAVVHYCEKNDVDIEVAASMIKSNFRIKSALQNEGEQLNFLPKTAKLPI